ncbi:MAG: hypothetical protein K8S18_08100 [Desulfobacula sp.]|nr:hypothetical protein [Desulfobacula sp.]
MFDFFDDFDLFDIGLAGAIIDEMVDDDEKNIKRIEKDFYDNDSDEDEENF